MAKRASASMTKTHKGSAARRGVGAQLRPGPAKLQRKSKSDRSAAVRFFTIFALALMMGGLASPQSSAQGSRRDDVVFGPTGSPDRGRDHNGLPGHSDGHTMRAAGDSLHRCNADDDFAESVSGRRNRQLPFLRAGRPLLRTNQRTADHRHVNYPDVILPADVSWSGRGTTFRRLD